VAAELVAHIAAMGKGAVLDLEHCMHVVQLYRCQKEHAVAGVSEPELRPRYLCLTPDRLLVLAAHPSRLGAGIVKSNHALAALAKVSSNKKKAPQRLVLWYRRGGGNATEVPTGAGPLSPGSAAAVAAAFDQRVYHLEAAEEFKGALMTVMSRLPPAEAAAAAGPAGAPASSP
jgi:hypothetical protein